MSSKDKNKLNIHLEVDGSFSQNSQITILIFLFFLLIISILDPENVLFWIHKFVTLFN